MTCRPVMIQRAGQSLWDRQRVMRLGSRAANSSMRAGCIIDSRACGVRPERRLMLGRGRLPPVNGHDADVFTSSADDPEADITTGRRARFRLPSARACFELVSWRPEPLLQTDVRQIALMLLVNVTGELILVPLSALRGIWLAGQQADGTEAHDRSATMWLGHLSRPAPKARGPVPQ